MPPIGLDPIAYGIRALFSIFFIFIFIFFFIIHYKIDFFITIFH